MARYLRRWRHSLDGAPPEATNRLYHNNHDGTFTDVTDKAGLRRTGWGQGVAVGDYDNDGHLDLFVTYWGDNALYRNNGDGTFTDIAAKAGLTPRVKPAYPTWYSGATFVDYDRDGKLDLFVATYTDYDLRRVPKPGANPNCNWKGVPTPCGPRGLAPGRHYLFHNRGDGTFEDVSEKSGIAKAHSSFAFTAVAADFDDDGWQDIYVACDSTPSLFFRNNRDGTFSEEGIERGVALNPDGMEQAGMGVTVGDFNGDGILDILKTSLRRRYARALPGAGQGPVRRCHAQGRAGGGNTVRVLGRRHAGSRQRRAARHLHRDRERVSRHRAPATRLSLRFPAAAVSQPGRRAFRGTGRRWRSGPVRAPFLARHGRWRHR